MSYQQTLSKIIAKSGYKLKEISEKCKELGVKVDPSYISKLQTGKQPPASEDVNVAIAKVCNYDPNELIYEAYIEKAPLLIKEIMSEFIAYFKVIKKEKSLLISETYFPIIKQQINNTSDYEFIMELREEDLLYGLIPDEELSKRFYGKIDSNFNKYDGDVFTKFIAMDDSMSPIIPEKSEVKIDTSAEVHPGDIVLARVKEEVYSLWWYYEDNENDKVFLVTENKGSIPLIISKNEVEIVGKVVSYTVQR